MSYAIYLTHPQIRIDPDVPAPQWELSEVGRARTEVTGAKPWVRTLKRIIASDETKAIETAEILAKAAGVEPEIAENMGENDRSATGFLPPPEFEAAADQFFAHPEESFKGWERAVDAQARIVTAVSTILDNHDPRMPLPLSVMPVP